MKQKAADNQMTVAFIGNPNCGKTTLFNAYTGAKLKVANWPGVTVEKKEGEICFRNTSMRVVDLPGTYSLTSYTMEERLSRTFILEENVDVIVDVVDASCLERNLYLTLQLIELGKPVVIALNMMDIVAERGIQLKVAELSKLFGVPVVPISAVKGTGLDKLLLRIKEYNTKAQPASKLNIYSDYIEAKINCVMKDLKTKVSDEKSLRWYAIKVLENDEDIKKQFAIKETKKESVLLEKQLINEKYDFIEEVIEKVMENRSQKEAFTDRIDKILTNRYLGLPIFFGIMAVIFFLTFTLGDIIKQYFEFGFQKISALILHVLQSAGVSKMMTSLIVDGILAGVGGILSFLPNIFILFVALAFLEDSGYMSRVAYVMDGVMGRIGLSGRAFIPLLLGFGCSVPAIMASRTLENMEDRKRTILMIPFMSCSARIPIYVLFSNLFFPNHATIVCFCMYVIGVFVAIFAAVVINITRKKQEENVLLIELPDYKRPNMRSIRIYVWEKVKDYLTKAGTTILLASLVVWGLLNLGRDGFALSMSDSFGAMIGRWLVPLLAPIGLDMWQIVVALISGIAAKEVVVSSFCILYGLTASNPSMGTNQLTVSLLASGFGPSNALAFMTFCLLYTPCAATIGVIKKELNSVRSATFAVVFQCAIAWLVSFFVYQVAQNILFL